MFSGIIAEVGTVKTLDGSAEAASLTVESSRSFSDVVIGESIAVNGVCLTVVQRHERMFVVDVSPQTLRATNLGELRPGDGVNLERSLSLTDRLGGHLVSGHVDGVGTIIDQCSEANALHYDIQVPEGLIRYMVPKGSIAVDGISLTIVACRPAGFQVTIIPHTAAVTTIGRKSIGATVNLECDMIGKYVERVLQARLEGVDAGEATLALLRRDRCAE
ncbi:MAG: riboflavin synthase [Planctomycetaceae bacterium]|nr:MAG: riboflavin synthase [Planctomycetaceae bacterium]